MLKNKRNILYGDLNNPKLTAASRFFCSLQGHRNPCVFLTWHFKLFRNRNAATTPKGHCVMALRRPWGGIRFLPCLGCLENRMVASQRPGGCITVGALISAVRQTFGSCNNREEGAVQSRPGLLAVTLWFLISWLVRSPCGRSNICDHTYHITQDLTVSKITFTIPRPQNRMASVWRQYDT